MENNSICSFKAFKDMELGKGELGLILGERGSGKTACLINMGIEGMLEGLKVLHVSLDDVPDRVESYYEVKIKEAIRLKDIKDMGFHDIEIKKTILSYLDQSFNVEKLESAIKNLGDPFDIMLIDGLETENMDVFTGIKEMSQENGLKTWITYSLNKYKENEDKLEDIFEVILRLYSDHASAYALLLKGKKGIMKEEIRLRLDPRTFFVK